MDDEHKWLLKEAGGRIFESCEIISPKYAHLTRGYSSSICVRMQ